MLLFSLLAFVGVVRAENVAKIGDVEYETLQEAVNVVQEGETITLIADVELAEMVTFPVGKTATLDLNGKSISMEESIISTAYALQNLGNLTLKDGVGTGSINARGIYNGAEDNTSAEMTVLSGTYNAKGTGGGAAIFNYAKAVLTGGTFTSVDSYSLNNRAGASMEIAQDVKATGGIYNTGAELTVNGANISNSRSGSHTIYAWNSAVIINDGTIHNNNAGNATVFADGTSTITIDGGKFSIANGKDIHGWTSCLIDAKGSAAYTINDGEFKGHIRVQTGAEMTINGGTFENTHAEAYAIYGTVSVKGGTFTDDASKNFASTYLAEGYIVAENNGVYTVAQPVAKIGETCYATLEDAFKAATSGCTIDILSDVTITEYWDARYTGAKFTVPVTINGNDKTIKFTNTVYDGGNYFAAFRFEADATVNNLTIDMSEAVSGFGGRFRAISSKGNLTVDGCTFIGNGADNNTRAIIFGEGAGTNASNLVISVVDSEFINWRRGISDNENAQDVKEVTVTGNTLTNAAVYVSATDNVTFTANTVEGAYVDIRSYTENNELNVTATGNTLEENTEKDKDYNYIDAGGSVEEEGFKTPVAQIGKKNYALLAEAISAAHKATDKVTITLKKDITVSAAISINKLVTIDFNGFEITPADNLSTSVFEVTGELCFKNKVEGSIADGLIYYIINDADYKAEAGKTFNLTENKEGVSVVYKRTFSHDGWQVLYVPFDIPVYLTQDKFKVYSITGISDVVELEQVTNVNATLNAHTPYIIKVHADKVNEVLHISGAAATTLYKPADEPYTVTYGNFTINGTYSSMAIDAESQYVLTNGKWCQLTEKAVTDGNNILGAFRVYLTANGENTSSEVRFVINNSDATAIDELKAENGNVKAEVYDLSGRRVEKAVKGIYVVNGVKVIK